MSKIFISYRREDSADTCGRIYDRLIEYAGEHTVFKDVDNIPPGADFRERLNQALHECWVAIVLIGPAWLDVRDDAGRRRIAQEGDFVRIEIETLLQREIPVIPVLVNGAQMPTAEQLPASIEPLAFRQALPVRQDPDFNRDMRRLRETLDDVLFQAIDPATADTLPVLPLRSCRGATSLRSGKGVVRTRVRVVNRSAQSIKLYWLDAEGGRKFYVTIVPGHEQHQPTYVSHVWMITDANDRCLGIFDPIDVPAQVSIEDAQLKRWKLF